MEANDFAATNDLLMKTKSCNFNVTRVCVDIGSVSDGLFQTPPFIKNTPDFNALKNTIEPYETFFFNHQLLGRRI